MIRIRLLYLTVFLLFMTACDCGPPPAKGCINNNQCQANQVCRNQKCVECPAAKPNICGELCVDHLDERAHCGKCDQKCNNSQMCLWGDCLCPSGLGLCKGNCVDLESNPQNCGACSRACASGEVCYAGKCIETKCLQQDPPVQNCGGACVDVSRSILHCGKCNNPCPVGQICSSGVCRCGPGQKLCDGRCVDLSSHYKHCGGCGKLCEDGKVCTVGKCVSTCPKLTPDKCFGGCFDLKNDVRHCGKCGNRCPQGETCYRGQCTCWATDQRCSGVCVDLKTNWKHCGRCKRDCPTGRVCADSRCVAQCPKVTPSPCFGGCFDLKTSPRHCGGCGQACELGLACVDGKCQAPPETQQEATSEPRGGTDAGEPTPEPTSEAKPEPIPEVKPEPDCTPKTEVCDGKDNDCDGEIDEEITNAPNCKKQRGVCKGSKKRCSGGVWIDCSASDYKNHDPAYAEKEIFCDKKDNDCDGGIDTDSAGDPQTRACYTGPAGTKGVGECRGGQDRCIAGSCFDQVTPKAETCDGKDNDCNGKVDDNVSKSCFTGPSSSQAGLGICKAGKSQCKAGKWGPCIGQVLPKKEVCNNIDDDCNGIEDSFTGSCYTGPKGTEGKGICKGGTSTCNSGKWGPCIGAITPQKEVCDGRDNNCDGIIDELCVSTVAGTPKKSGHKDGPAKSSLFNFIRDVAIDQAGNLFVVEDNNVVRKITISGIVSTIAGVAKQSGDKNGTAKSALFDSPTGIAVDKKGNLYVADNNNCVVRKITGTGDVSTLAGNSKANPGYKDGSGKNALFRFPSKLTLDAKGNLYISDSSNNVIRKVTVTGVVSTIAGVPNITRPHKDGPAKSALFALPDGLVFDAKGNLYIADKNNHVIRKMDTKGIVSTFAGTPTKPGHKDGPGKSALFDSPASIAIDAKGNLYVADSNNNAIRKISVAGIVSTIAGASKNKSGHQDGVGRSTLFFFPAGLRIHSGVLYIVDTGNYVIRKIILP